MLENFKIHPNIIQAPEEYITEKISFDEKKYYQANLEQVSPLRFAQLPVCLLSKPKISCKSGHLKWKIWAYQYFKFSNQPKPIIQQLPSSFHMTWKSIWSCINNSNKWTKETHIKML